MPLLPPLLTSAGPPLINGNFVPNVNLSHIAHYTSNALLPPAGWHEIDGYQEEWNQDSAQITRIFIGPWVTRQVFLFWALGASWSLQDPNNPNGGIIQRALPAQHPEFPWLYAQSARLLRGQGAWRDNPYVGPQDECGNIAQTGGIAPIGYAAKPIPMIAYFDHETGSDANSAMYAVTYQPVDYEIRQTPDPIAGELSRFVTRSFNYASKAQTIPASRLYFTFGAGKKFQVPEPGVWIFNSQEITYTWHMVPDLPISAINNCLGKVNIAPFDGAPGYELYGPGTLLCLAPETVRKRGLTGRIYWDITYKFLHVDNGDQMTARGHNYFPYFNNLTNMLSFEHATLDGTETGQELFARTDFNQLFTVPAPQNYQTSTLPSTACP
jgi:hypothetical protein